MQSAIILAIDSLQASALGAYGNTIRPTRAFDHLAAESFLFDFALADGVDLDEIYRGFWRSIGPWAPSGGSGESIPLPTLAKRLGLRCALAVDEPSVADMPLAADFDDVLLVEHPPTNICADAIEQTEFFRLLAVAGQWLQTVDEPFLLWIHARGMSGRWDAPLKWRRSLAELDDPEPGDFVEPPSRRLEEDFDPDELLEIKFAYEAQTALIDAALGLFLEQIASHRIARQALFGLTGVRGYPLGEHRRVGAVDRSLYDEQLHVPLLLRLPDGQAKTCRSQALVCPSDLYATVADFLGAEAPANSLLPIVQGQTESIRECLAIQGVDGDQALRTTAWHLLVKAEGMTELYAKPDDRCEANDVASRCAATVEQLTAVLAQYVDLAKRGELHKFGPLAELLEAGAR